MCCGSGSAYHFFFKKKIQYFRPWGGHVTGALLKANLFSSPFTILLFPPTHTAKSPSPQNQVHHVGDLILFFPYFTIYSKATTPATIGELPPILVHIPEITLPFVLQGHHAGYNWSTSSNHLTTCMARPPRRLHGKEGRYLHHLKQGHHAGYNW